MNKGLTVVRDHFHFYCETVRKNCGFRLFWSIKSSNEFLKVINSSDVFSLQVFDFSTLYTNLGQNEIISHLFQLFDFIFNSSSRRLLCVGRQRSFFAKKLYDGYHCFDLAQFKEAIRFIVSEVYVCFGGLVFKQIRGIPMGGNCSPLLADLFLLHCEFVFMNTLLSSKKKIGLAKLLSRTTRYIDDLCIFNYKHFDTLLPKIYPSDLIAERNGTNDRSVDYLDVKICVEKDSLHTSVFHKVEDFPFEVILFTFPESLLPNRLGPRIFAGQVLRYLRICSHVEYVVTKVKYTCDIFIKRGYNLRSLRVCMEKLLNNYFNLLLKFGLFNSRQLSQLCGLV